MYYKVELDFGMEHQDIENPVFYLKEDELISFINICSRNNQEVIVLHISEDEYEKNVSIE